MSTYFTGLDVLGAFAGKPTAVAKGDAHKAKAAKVKAAGQKISAKAPKLGKRLMNIGTLHEKYGEMSKKRTKPVQAKP